MVSTLLLVAAIAAAPQAAERQTTPRRQFNPRPHTIGIGGGGGSNFGAGGSLRVWFSKHIGVDAGISYVRRPGSDIPSARRFAPTFQAMPSLLYLFKDENPDVEIDFRPYLGAGFNYSKAFQPEGYVAAPGSRLSGFGSQVSGGIEMSFKEIEFMTISGEIAWVELPVRFFGSQALDGLNYEFSFHFYFK